MQILIADDPGQIPAIRLSWQHSAAGEAASSDGAHGAAHPMQEDSLDLQDQPELAGTVLEALGLALLHRGYTAQARALLARSLEIRRRVYGDEHPVIAASLVSRARLQRKEGDLNAALADAERALQISSGTGDRNSLLVVQILCDLAVIQLVRGDLAAAEHSARSGLEALATAHLQQTDPNVSRLLDTIGRVHQLRGEYEQARSVYRTVLELDRRQVGEHHIKYATHLANFATVQAAQGHFDSARTDFETALAVFRHDARRPQHPNVVDILANLGSLLSKRDPQAAANVLTQALELDRKIRGKELLLVGNDHARLGRVVHQAGALDRAEQHFHDALAIYEHNVREQKMPAAHPFIAEAQTWAARLSIETSPPRPEQARQLAAAALDIWRVQYGEQSLEYQAANGILGRALLQIDPHSAEGRARVKAAYPIVAAARGADSPLARLIQAGR